MNQRLAQDLAVAHEIRQALAERILVIDGAMGTMIQARGLQEEDFRRGPLAGHSSELRGNNEALNLTRPDVIADIHRQYFAAGADIAETNTFNANRISQADYGTEALVVEMNRAAAALAARAAREAERASPGRRCWVAGAIGPTNRTLSLSPDVNRPGYRAVSYDQVRAAYAEQTRALIEGGADLLLVETIFDTLNAKAAILAIEEVQEELHRALPLMVSVTITDASGRTLSGQTIEAFWNSIAHARPVSVGVNCALGGQQMRPYLEALARRADCAVSCHPNAGLPNALGGYDESPSEFASCLCEYAREGWLNLAGGCCGTTPAHISALAAALKGTGPRRPSAADAGVLRLSGLEPLDIP